MSDYDYQVRPIDSDLERIEYQLAKNVNESLRKGLGIGTLTKLQMMIDDSPLTKPSEASDIDVHPLDDDD